MRTSIVSALVFAALGVGLASSAGATARVVNHDEDVARATVHYGDLDLKTRQGADQLYSRINMAAMRVCQDITEPYVRLTRTYTNCRHEAVSDAVREVNTPLVTQAYEQHAAKYLGETATHHTTSNRAPHA
ncbi:MAG TPA: UrcA family protein [Gammaproteobacteria bacterium]